jgi:hypothetical protein
MAGTRKNPEAGDPDEWESAELTVKRPSGAVVSVRMPAELLIALESFAEARSLSVSEVIRLASERLLKVGDQAPTFAVVATASALRLAGPTVLVHAMSVGTMPVWQEGPSPSATSSSGLGYA